MHNLSPTLDTIVPMPHQRIRWVEAPALARLASLYVHVILRRLVPNLATEIHLAVRLLHVHPNTTRSFSTELSSSVQACEQVSPIQGSRTHPPMADGQNNTSTNGISSIRSVFTSGLDCRAFAAHVFLGLESLLPHVGVDTLETLARTSALDSEVSTSAVSNYYQLCVVMVSCTN